MAREFTHTNFITHILTSAHILFSPTYTSLVLDTHTHTHTHTPHSLCLSLLARAYTVLQRRAEDMAHKQKLAMMRDTFRCFNSLNPKP